MIRFFCSIIGLSIINHMIEQQYHLNAFLVIGLDFSILLLVDSILYTPTQRK